MRIHDAKVTAEHLSRRAFVYVRQSTGDQVQNNLESQRLQYRLVDRARDLGWSQVDVIDDDLGRSAGGGERPGFEKLLAAVCAGEVGIVLSSEASRLSRNGREWHTLLEFCAVVGCLLGDRDTIYDPRLAHDRFLLGMQGSVYELELSVLRQRSREAQWHKAGRGELFTTVAIGYVKVGQDRIEMDPDQRVRDAVALVFRKFAEFGSGRQVHLWFRQEGIELPAAWHGPRGREVIWKPPVYNSIKKMLANPVYAGAYVWGRSIIRVDFEGGHKRIAREYRSNPEDWPILILDHHDGYIEWDEYEKNQRMIADNAGSMPSARRAVRHGSGILAGLLRCGHCGRKLQVNYRGKFSARYKCRGSEDQDGERCVSFGALRADEAVGEAVIRAVAPQGVEAALLAIEDANVTTSEAVLHAQQALEEARFRSDEAHWRYAAVNPDHRLVADNLERLWNDRLQVVQECEERLSRVQAQSQRQDLTPEDRAPWLAMGAELERAWRHEAAPPELRKRILRAALVEIVVTVADNIVALVLHWQGGSHTELRVRKNRTGEHRLAAGAETVELIRELARIMPDRLIASFLNRAGKKTGKGNNWTLGRLKAFRSNHDIPVYRDGEMRERNEMKLEEAAEYLSVDEKTVRRLIRSGAITARQACKGAPWVIDATVLPKRVQDFPPAQKPHQENLCFQ